LESGIVDAKIEVQEDGVSTLIWRLSEPTVAEAIWEEGQVMINTKTDKNFKVRPHQDEVSFTKKKIFSFERYALL